ncbi:MAG: hypothetical protein AB7L94_33715, partial [Kofleriaceae bacterium]
RLWNKNAPDDPIAEDGDYGPATEERVKRAPAEGFGVGASCVSAMRAVDVESGDHAREICAE